MSLPELLLKLTLILQRLFFRFKWLRRALWSRPLLGKHLERRTINGWITIFPSSSDFNTTNMFSRFIKCNRLDIWKTQTPKSLYENPSRLLHLYSFLSCFARCSCCAIILEPTDIESVIQPWKMYSCIYFHKACPAHILLLVLQDP